MVDEDDSIETDVLVIGAGPGGYTAAIRAAQHDLDVTLVEKDAFGGVCLNHGCIPSKAYISATDTAHDAKQASEMGIFADPVIDMTKMQEWKSSVTSKLAGAVEKLCKANGVTLVEGTASFVDEHEVRVTYRRENRGRSSVTFDRCVISTGSRPIQIPGFDFTDRDVWSSRDALAAESVPDRLVVVGAGYIGMELSTVFAKLGAEVSVVEMLDDALPAYEDDVTRVVRKRASELDIDFHFGEGASEWRDTDDGIEVITETEDGVESVHPADKVLVAVGRQPVTDTLGLKNIGLLPNGNGFIETDRHGRTSVEHVFAVGDVAGEPMLAHKASKEGTVAADTLADKPTPSDTRSIPAAVFTDPELGTVGLTKSDAEREGYDPVVGKFPFRASGRALTTGDTTGFVRVVADGERGTILGAQIVGADASELVAEVALAIDVGATLEDIATTVHTHPTLSEAVMEAAENAQGHAIHTLNR
ncbi:dihydrolipoamide dehydrogenase [Halogeometricum pallidum JCM 14848]|uniref:Dihydrolipoyl dehydrogenase n=1 Tax=Halogeometricum pallidum JCM 14848 TaxID=1227487 RepID=M0D1I0_HALPD|nr:dihydrolipoyl dehydrogenase [Halogeometricum pallidum]ELZ29376.1 dihydrolipoamide dehydrogenase [Halogeometricum pallidum JCM 14848]